MGKKEPKTIFRLRGKSRRIIPADRSVSRKNFLFIIPLIFFCSGASALIYETVWLRMLSRIMGVTVYATSTLLATFMGGLALGSFVFGKFIDRRKDQLKIYAIMELAIGLTAMLVPLILSWSFPIYRFVYDISGESFFFITLSRALVISLTLLIPTTIMGGTLPVLMSWLVKRKGSRFGESFSLLYGLNTAGAVVGVLLSGFVTIGMWGESLTILLGVGINIIIALISYGLYQTEKIQESQPEPSLTPSLDLPQNISPYSITVRRVVLLVFVFSGFTSLAYEVIWTRQLILFLSTSIYAFAAMLAVYLLGIAFGSWSIQKFADRLSQPLVLFGVLEVLVGFISILNLYLFPLFDSPTAASLFGRPRVLLATFMIIFPVTFLFGMIFPVAGVCYARDTAHTGSSVGVLYSANTLGTILGSLAAGFLLIPLWGSSHAVLLLGSLNVVLGFFLLGLETKGNRLLKHSYVVLLPVLLILIFRVMEQNPFLNTIENRIKLFASKTKNPGRYEIYYSQEGLEGTVTAFSIDKNKRLWINGVGMTSLCTETKLMAHLPLMFVESPKNMLVVCFGMGTTLRSAALYPTLRVSTVELVPETYKTFQYYHDDAQQVLQKPNVRPYVNDGRNFLLLSDQTYDVITIDPAPPIWSAGTVNLYTREFFQVCKERLTPKGVMCLWFPGNTTEDEVKSLLKTFHAVFPETQVFGGPRAWGFYFIGHNGSPSPPLFRKNMEEAFKNPEIVADLAEYDQKVVSPRQLHRLLLWDTEKVRQISAEGIMVTDDFPYTEFFLWRYFSKGVRFWQPHGPVSEQP